MTGARATLFVRRSLLVLIRRSLLIRWVLLRPRSLLARRRLSVRLGFYPATGLLVGTSLSLRRSNGFRARWLDPLGNVGNSPLVGLCLLRRTLSLGSGLLVRRELLVRLDLLVRSSLLGRRRFVP
jgi:hypothetical protein